MGLLETTSNWLTESLSARKEGDDICENSEESKLSRKNVTVKNSTLYSTEQ